MSLIECQYIKNPPTIACRSEKSANSSVLDLVWCFQSQDQFSTALQSDADLLPPQATMRSLGPSQCAIMYEL
jgi:hypothetical protein